MTNFQTADVDATTVRRREVLERDLAPVFPFLIDDAVTDILRNSDGTVWVDRLGTGMEKADVSLSDAQAESMLRTVASMVGRPIGPDHPSLQAELEYPRLFRLQGLIAPIVESTVFAIRKPGLRILTLADYQDQGVLDAGQVAVIKRAVLDKSNILIGGGTGSGKTTLANAILAELSKTGDRLFIVEDTRELRCSAPNHLSVRVAGLTAEDEGYSYARAIQDALRLRPDRIIVGEVRNRAALDLVKAWNTGHPGGMATLHANSPLEMLERLCWLVEEATKAPRPLIASTINFLIHIRRDSSSPGGRTVALARVEGTAPDGAFLLSDL